jgi:hypothetical protein
MLAQIFDSIEAHVSGGFTRDFKIAYENASSFNEAIGVVRNYTKNYGSLVTAGTSPMHIQH